jgi:prevent-host-death family protein
LHGLVITAGESVPCDVTGSHSLETALAIAAHVLYILKCTKQPRSTNMASKRKSELSSSNRKRLAVREASAGVYGASRHTVVIPASEFRERCLQLMDEVQRERIQVVVTKHGRPIARLVSAEETTAPQYFGALRDLGQAVWHVNPDRIPPDTDADKDWERRSKKEWRSR